MSYLFTKRYISSLIAYTPRRDKVSSNSSVVTQPLESLSNIEKASERLKSGYNISLFLASSSSVSSEICSLNALTNSSSSDYFNGDYLFFDALNDDEPSLEEYLSWFIELDIDEAIRDSWNLLGLYDSFNGLFLNGEEALKLFYSSNLLEVNVEAGT